MKDKPKARAKAREICGHEIGLGICGLPEGSAVHDKENRDPAFYPDFSHDYVPAVVVTMVRQVECLGQVTIDEALGKEGAA